MCTYILCDVLYSIEVIGKWWFNNSPYCVFIRLIFFLHIFLLLFDYCHLLKHNKYDPVIDVSFSSFYPPFKKPAENFFSFYIKNKLTLQVYIFTSKYVFLVGFFATQWVTSICNQPLKLIVVLLCIKM